MDTQALLQQILDAMASTMVLSQSDRDKLVCDLHELAEWIDNGGFIPRV